VREKKSELKSTKFFEKMAGVAKSDIEKKEKKRHERV